MKALKKPPFDELSGKKCHVLIGDFASEEDLFRSDLELLRLILSELKTMTWVLAGQRNAEDA